jgi:hypothetical protein
MQPVIADDDNDISLKSPAYVCLNLLSLAIHPAHGVHYGSCS